MRKRLDEELVSQGFFQSQDEAMRAVLAGRVFGKDRSFNSAGEQVPAGIELHVKGALPFVSRGGLKLEHGLRELGLDVADKACVDVGCSTGGFTHCLLSHNAAHVLAVDVGYAQFSWDLRKDGRVSLLERTNINSLLGSTYSRSFDVAVCDVSFTSVVNILDTVCDLLNNQGSFLTLVKPQFEAGRNQVDTGGIVTSAEVRLEALTKVANAFVRHGLMLKGACQSPILGAKGNIEYLLLGSFVSGKQSIELKRVVDLGATIVAS